MVGKRIIFVMIILSIISSAYAEDDVIFSLNSTEYYFPLNTQANVPVYVTNNLGKDISGQLSYTIIENIVMQGFQSSSSNTQSQPFMIGKDYEDTALGFGFGTSDKETTREVSMSFSYNDGSTQQNIILPEIKIHFVVDLNQQQQQQNQQSQQSQQQSSQNQQQAKQSQQQTQHQPQTSDDQMQKNIQNNQKSQDTNALKDQIQRETQEEKRIEEQAKQEVQANQQYQEQKEQLEDMGFRPDSEPHAQGDEMKQSFTNPETGEKANLSADISDLKESLKNNQTPNSNMEVKSSFQNKNLENQIMKNPASKNQDLKDRISELQSQGFNQSDTLFSNQNNQTTFTKTLTNPNTNQTVNFTGTLDNSTITQFEEKNDSDTRSIILLLLTIIILSILGYYLYGKYYRKEEEISTQIIKRTLPVDYRKESLEMVKESKKVFEKNRKDAYELLSYALRYYYSHKLDLKKEMTNKELLDNIKDKSEIKDIKHVLQTASLVEFAKAKGKKQVFDESVSVAEKLIK